MNQSETSALLRSIREQRDASLAALAERPSGSPSVSAADAWTGHYSLALGARTPRHAREIVEKCRAAGVPFSGFDKHGRLKVDSMTHQRQLMKAIIGRDCVNKDSYY